MFNNALKKIFDGLLYGIGFSVPFSAAFYFAMVFSTNGILDDSSDLGSLDNYGFTILESHLESINGDDYVVGSIQNTNNTTIRSASIEAEFFDATDKFINKCTGSIGGSFKINEKRNFKLKCKPTNTEHTRYVVIVTGAYAWDW